VAVSDGGGHSDVAVATDADRPVQAAPGADGGSPDWLTSGEPKGMLEGKACFGRDSLRGDEGW
jgi:hypothetical protein